jgi:hypothetical protein
MLQWILISLLSVRKAFFLLAGCFRKNVDGKDGKDINDWPSYVFKSTYDILFILNFCINMYMQTFAVC